MKKLVFSVASLAVAISNAWAQSDAFAHAPYGYEPGYYYYGSPNQPQPAGPPGVDPTAHYWDYYPLEPGHGIDMDRTTPP